MPKTQKPVTNEATNSNPKGQGRGKKQCPECLNFVGARTVNCECGNHTFTIKNGTSKGVKQYRFDPIESYPVKTELPQGFEGCDEIRLIPKIEIPIPIPEAFTSADLIAWTKDVREHGKLENTYYAKEALLKWGYDSLGNSDLFNEFRRVIESPKVPN